MDGFVARAPLAKGKTISDGSYYEMVATCSRLLGKCHLTVNGEQRTCQLEGGITQSMFLRNQKKPSATYPLLSNVLSYFCL